MSKALAPYQGLPRAVQVRVFWRTASWAPMTFGSFGPDSGQETFYRKVNGRREKLVIPSGQNVNVDDPTRWQNPKFTGTAIGFNTDVVLVQADNGKIYLLPPACLGQEPLTPLEQLAGAAQ